MVLVILPHYVQPDVDYGELVVVAALATFEIVPQAVLALRHRNFHFYQSEFDVALGPVDLYRRDGFPRPFERQLAKDMMSSSSGLGPPFGSRCATFLLPSRGMARCWFLKVRYERCEVGIQKSRVLSRT